MRRRFRWDKKYLYWGITGFVVIAASIVFFMLLNYLPLVGQGIQRLGTILAPFVWGLVLTYLMSPLMRGMEQLFSKAWKRRKKPVSGHTMKAARYVSVFVSEIALLLILAAFVWMIIPQLYSSIETIVVSSPQYLDKMQGWVGTTLEEYPAIEQYVSGWLDSFNANLIDFARNQLLPSVGSFVSNVTTGVIAVGRVIYNLIVGIIVSVYLLSNKEKAMAGVRKLLYSVFNIDTAENIRKASAFIDRTFMGFLSGKILDSAIIGLICYIFCAIVNMPYALLVSVICGVTNIIPYFGPLIGAVPSGLIILLVDPVKCLIFVVFTIILQQIDGNILGPKILGSSIGINGFWVMFSIILGGGLFGFAGMILGVPVFVVIYTGISSLIRKKLKSSDLPQETADYEKLDFIDSATREVHWKEQ